MPATMCADDEEEKGGRRRRCAPEEGEEEVRASDGWAPSSKSEEVCTAWARTKGIAYQYIYDECSG